MSDVTRVNFGGDPYPHLQELHDQLLEVIHTYNDLVPLLGVLGVLRLLEHTLLKEAE